MTERRHCASCRPRSRRPPWCSSRVAGRWCPAPRGLPRKGWHRGRSESCCSSRRRFPPAYPAVVLPNTGRFAGGARPHRDSAGARVDPPGCKPPQQDYTSNGTAIAVVRGSVSRSTRHDRTGPVSDSAFGTRSATRPMSRCHRHCDGVDVQVRTAITRPPESRWTTRSHCTGRSNPEGRWGGDAVDAHLMAQIDGRADPGHLHVVRHGAGRERRRRPGRPTLTRRRAEGPSRVSSRP